MEHIEFYAVIKFLNKQRKPPQTIMSKMESMTSSIPTQDATLDITETIEKLILEEILKKPLPLSALRHFVDPTSSSSHDKSQCKMGSGNAHAASKATKNRSVKGLFGAVW